MKFFHTHLLIIRFLLLAFLFTGSSCHSSGQKNNDDSDWQGRRKIPEYIMEELPKAPDTLAETEHFIFYKYGEFSNFDIDDFAEKSELIIANMESFTNKPINNERYKWYLYPSCEMKGLMLKNSTPCQVDFEKKEIHAVVNHVFADHYLGKENEMVLTGLLGLSDVYALQAGLAICFSEKWQKMGHRYWTGKLLAANQLPSLDDLLDNEKWAYSSDLIFGSAAASFCGFLIEHFGKNVFLEKYNKWGFSNAERKTLEPLWRAYCGQWAEPQKTAATAPPLPYLKGFNFAHEGYRIYNGYGSRKADQSLEYLKNMGANAVAIIPYSFTRTPKEPSPIPVSKRAGSENDESVIHTAESAQALGQKVVMKPQIWLGRGLWTGDIDMKSDEDWKAFFKHYGHWTTHYAMLAEIYGWEMLCLGTELVQTTLKREQDWRTLIQNTRIIYGGLLTYAANWGEEFENIKIWDDLDYIGLNCYYPLSKKDNPSNRELAKGFNDVVKKIEKVYARYKKPLLFTEIGFPCINAPWKQPHQDKGDFEANAEHQKRCYEVVLNGIKNKPWCHGILWWKYPSDLEHKHRGNTGFTPHGNPAENVVAKWFLTPD